METNSQFLVSHILRNNVKLNMEITHVFIFPLNFIILASHSVNVQISNHSIIITKINFHIENDYLLKLL